MSKKLLLSVVALAAATSAFAEEAAKAPEKKVSKKALKKVEQRVEDKAEQKASYNDVKVTIGGDMDFQVGSTNQSDRFEYLTPSSAAPAANASKVHDFGFVNNSDIKVAVDAQHAGLKYGGRIVINANTSATKLGHGAPAGETMVYTESMFGRLEGGSTASATLNMKAAAASVATGGADQGDWQYWVNPVWNVAGGNMDKSLSNTFLMNGSLPADYNSVADNASSSTTYTLNSAANKLSYYTPSWNGLKLGVSYTPDSAVSGTTSGLAGVAENNAASSTQDAQGFKNIVSGGALFTHSMDKVSMKFSLLGQTGSSKDFGAEKRKDLRAYEVAGGVGYMGFNLGGSYGSWGDSGQKEIAGKKHVKTDYYTVSLGYEYNSLALSTKYFGSNKGGVNDGVNQGNKNKLTAWSLGAQYKLAQGFMPYVEYTNFKLTQNRAASTAVENKGGVVLVGTKLFF